MGREVQRIGLGFMSDPEKRRDVKRSPRQWLGMRLERFGRRLQDSTSPQRTLAAVRSQTG